MNSSLLKNLLYILAFIEGFCVLAIQIGGTRVLAPVFGASIFVWTSQISITLIALAVGYIVAGKLTERFHPIRMLSLTLTTATGWLAALPFMKGYLLAPLLNLDPRLGVLLGAGMLFGIPLLLLGGTGPIIIKALVETAHESGKISGRIFGISTFGSVAGAIYLGFFGLGIHSTNQIIWGLSGLTGLCSLVPIFLLRNPYPALLIILPLLASLLPKHVSENNQWTVIHAQPSAYGRLAVAESSDGQNVFRCLFNDALQQNCVLQTPRIERTAGIFHTNQIAILAEMFGKTGGEVLVVGSAGGALPMYLAQRGAQVDIIEINPAMFPIAQSYFDFNPSLMRTIIIEDGRAAIRKLSTFYDMIILNAFIGDSFPSHLVTEEALGAMARRLKKDGVVITNLIGNLATESGQRSYAALHATYHSVFGFNRFFSTPSIRNSPANIFVLSTRENPPKSPTPGIIPHVTVLKGDLEALSFTMLPPRRQSVSLTDNFNPIEHLDAPTRQELRRNFLKSFHDPLLFNF